MNEVLSAPKWDMSVVYPGLDSSEFRAGFEACQVKLSKLEELFDSQDIRSGGEKSGSTSRLDAAIVAINDFESDFETIGSYIYAFVTTDATDSTAQAKLSELMKLDSTLRKLKNRLAAYVAQCDVKQYVSDSNVGKDHEYALTKMKVLGDNQMSPAEEDLAADLMETGSSAWGRLHGDVTSQIMVTYEANGTSKTEPMAVARAMAYDPDRSVRESAYHAELETWTQFEVPLAAAMNSIKGETDVLCTRRGWDSALARTVFNCNMDMATLDAMMGAARDSFPAFRRYFKAKARLVNESNSLDWFDIFAPIGEDTKVWQYNEGAEFVAQQFSTYSDRMGDFARRSYAENWIDAAPASGKRDGAFCMGLRADESRILMTWKPSFGSVSTLAHELGHAYHNLCLHGKTELQKQTPMTLAETASIFCETIITKAALSTGSPEENLPILEQSVQRAAQTVVDISSRFLFEQAVFEKRASRSLSPSELCDLMLWAQGETYGEGLSNHRHPYMWAVKPHYYSYSSFYNFPYMFGHLFSLGLYSVYRNDPEAFKARYDTLLASTGLSDAATLAKGFGIDITTAAFWEGSLATICEEIDQFVELTR